jgi:hypothetical protein
MLIIPYEEVGLTDRQAAVLQFNGQRWDFDLTVMGLVLQFSASETAGVKGLEREVIPDRQAAKKQEHMENTE